MLNVQGKLIYNATHSFYNSCLSSSLPVKIKVKNTIDL